MSGENAYRILNQRCPNCGAQIPFDAGENYICTYCQSSLTLPKREKPASEAKPEAPATEEQPPQSTEPKLRMERTDISYHKLVDPTEGAFSVSVPDGWQTQGGVMRPDMAWQGGYSPAMSAKIDFMVMNNPQAQVAIRWLPDVVYVDARVSGMGMMYPPGSNYNGMMVYPVMPATQFLSQFVFPNIHAMAQSVSFTEQRTLHEVAQGYHQRMMAAMPYNTASYDAGMIAATYQENGTSFKEYMVTVVENTGVNGGRMWGNKETLLVRAPETEFDKWLPVFSTLQQSVELNPEWLASEIRQLINMGMIVMNNAQVQAYIQSIIQNQKATVDAINQALFA